MTTSELETEVGKLRKRVRKLRKRADASDGEQAALRKKVDDRDGRIEKLSTAMRQFASRLGKLDGGG